MTTGFKSQPKNRSVFSAQPQLSGSAEVDMSVETLALSSTSRKPSTGTTDSTKKAGSTPNREEALHFDEMELEHHPHKAALPPLELEMIRCSMPSLSKMPSAARHVVSNMFSFFYGSPSPQPRTCDKVGVQFSTPQMDRKTRVNGTRRLSDGQTNGEVGKVDDGEECKAKEKKQLSKLESNLNSMANAKLIEKYGRLKVKNVERWEPTAYEKELLRRTWSDEFEFLYELGSAIYTFIFEHNPNCKQLFPQLIKYGENWKDSREFRAQALKFVQTLSQVVKNIYHKDRLEPYLYGIGQLHCKYANRGFKPEYWEDFQDAMEHSLAEHMNSLADLDTRQRLDAIRVWRTLALYVIAHMKAGYFDGLKCINKHPPLA